MFRGWVKTDWSKLPESPLVILDLPSQLRPAKFKTSIIKYHDLNIHEIPVNCLSDANELSKLYYFKKSNILLIHCELQRKL